jgi:hypothetical protein
VLVVLVYIEDLTTSRGAHPLISREEKGEP